MSGSSNKKAKPRVVEGTVVGKLGTNPNVSFAAKAGKAEAEEYTGPIEFEFNGETYTSRASGNCPEMYDVAELMQDDKLLPALRALLDADSYMKFRQSKPKPTDGLGMWKAFGEAAGTPMGESDG